jgi:glycosyltransferase involved in cell wall biosynthesis
LNEILGLEELGVPLRIFALVDSQETVIQPQAARVRARVDYLEAGLKRGKREVALEHIRVFLAHPSRYVSTLVYLVRHPELNDGYAVNNRRTAFLQAVYLVNLLQVDRRVAGKDTIHLHAHFAHDPALVASLAHRLTGIPFSITTHARDLYQLPHPVLVDRVSSAQAVITCCGANIRYLQEHTPAEVQEKLHLIYHGVNLDAFQPAVDGSQENGLPLIVSAGRLIEKKGFADLLAALAEVHRTGVGFRCVIYGDGPLRSQLEAQIQQSGLRDRVHLEGIYTQEKLANELQRASIFALTPRITEDGDRDGIPNVLLEAMACGKPVVSTAVAGIPELVTHGENGLLSSPQDISAIQAGLISLLQDPAARQKMGATARQTVKDRFDLRSANLRLADLFFGAEGGR